jgi:hypothetical protein
MLVFSSLTETRIARMYQKIRGIGAVYAEWQPPSTKPFFQIDHDDGETFVWIGRLHLILTPWAKLRATGEV